MNTLVLAMRAWMLIWVMVMLAGCVGAGWGLGGSTPVIFGLVITPTVAYVSATPQVFDSQFEFTDADGDLASVTLEIVNGSGVTVSLEILPIFEVEGLTAGVVLGEIKAMSADPDIYTAQIYVTDSTGLQSNTLIGTARIEASP